MEHRDGPYLALALFFQAPSDSTSSALELQLGGCLQVDTSSADFQASPACDAPFLSSAHLSRPQESAWALTILINHHDSSHCVLPAKLDFLLYLEHIGLVAPNRERTTD